MQQDVRDLLPNDGVREPLNDGSFPDTWLSDEHRVIFSSPAQDLNDAGNFFVSSDDRIEGAGARAFGKVGAVFVKDTCNFPLEPGAGGIRMR